MATKTRKKGVKSKIDNQEIEFIITHRVLNEPGVEAHSGGVKKLTRKVEEIKEEMGNMMEKLNHIFQQAEKAQASSKFVLDEITIGMGFSATGGIAFIVEAGIEASLEFKFKRK